FAGRADTHVLSLFGQRPRGYSDPTLLLDMDLIYVGGGSTANLLSLWRRHGVDEIMVRAAAEEPFWPESAPARTAGSKPHRPTPSGRWPHSLTGSGSFPAAHALTTMVSPAEPSPSGTGSPPVSCRARGRPSTITPRWSSRTRRPPRCWWKPPRPAHH